MKEPQVESETSPAAQSRGEVSLQERPASEPTPPQNGHAPPAAAAEDAEFGAGIGMFHAFRYRDFRWLWFGNTFSGAAMWIQQTTMGWLAYDLTGSGAVLGAVNSIRNIPTLAAAPIAGVAADRYSRNSVVAVSQVLSFLNAFALAIAIYLGVLEVWHLFVFAIVAGTLMAFNNPARQAMVFNVVPREAVPNAIALNNTAMNVTRTLGPMVGGGLIVFFGPGNNFMIQALAYLGVLVTVLMVKRIPPRLGPGRRSFTADLKEGYKWAAANPNARLLFLMLVLYPSFIIPVHLGLMPIMAANVFHTDAGGLGLLLSALGIGGLVGGLIAASLNRVDQRGLVQLLALFVVAGFLALFGVIGGMTGNLWIGVGLLVLSGAGGSLFNTTNQTVLQLIAPDELRGRVTGLLNIQPLFQSIGILATGIAADFAGAATVATVNGLLMCAVGLAILAFSPRMRNLRLSRLGGD